VSEKRGDEEQTAERLRRAEQAEARGPSRSGQ
jgi:hypothetical protein